MATDPTTSDPEASQARMSFGEHLEELRKRIIRALFGSIFGVGLCLVYYKTILDIVTRPYRLAARAHHLPDVLNTFKPQEGFLSSITLAFQAGLVLSSPWIIFQIWQFVAAGLFPRERKIVYRYTAPSTLLFLLGVAFFYFIVLPMTLNFFMNFTAHTAGPLPTPNRWERLIGLGDAATQPSTATAPSTQPATTQAAPATQAQTLPAIVPMALPVLLEDPPPPPDGIAYVFVDARDGRIKMRYSQSIMTIMVSEEGSLFASTWRFDDYLSFVLFTALVFGLAFELPMVILILAQTGIVETQTFRNIRKYAYFTILIVAAIAAPSGDLMTLFFLTFPLIGLYELGIIAAAIAVKRQQAAAESP